MLFHAEHATSVLLVVGLLGCRKKSTAAPVRQHAMDNMTELLAKAVRCGYWPGLLDAANTRSRTLPPHRTSHAHCPLRSCRQRTKRRGRRRCSRGRTKRSSWRRSSQRPGATAMVSLPAVCCVPLCRSRHSPLRTALRNSCTVRGTAASVANGKKCFCTFRPLFALIICRSWRAVGRRQRPAFGHCGQHHGGRGRAGLRRCAADAARPPGGRRRWPRLWHGGATMGRWRHTWPADTSNRAAARACCCCAATGTRVSCGRVCNEQHPALFRLQPWHRRVHYPHRHAAAGSGVRAARPCAA